MTIGGIASGSRAMLEELVRAADLDRFDPVIDRSFGFGFGFGFPCRHAYLKSSAHLGKVVIGFGE